MFCNAIGAKEVTAYHCLLDRRSKLTTPLELGAAQNAVRNRFKKRNPLRGAGRGERIRTSGLYVPNVALHQAELHPVYN